MSIVEDLYKWLGNKFSWAMGDPSQEVFVKGGISSVRMCPCLVNYLTFFFTSKGPMSGFESHALLGNFPPGFFIRS